MIAECSWAVSALENAFAVASYRYMGIHHIHDLAYTQILPLHIFRGSLHISREFCEYSGMDVMGAIRNTDLATAEFVVRIIIQR